MATAKITIEAQVQQALAGLQQVNDRLKALERNSQQATRAMSAMKAQTDLAARAMNTLVGAISVGVVINLADAATLVNNKLRSVSGSAEEAAGAFQQVGRIAQLTGQQFEAVGDLYQKIALQSRQLGLSQQEVARITENFSKALVVTGTTGQAAASAIYQFGQSLGRGKVAYEDIRQLQEASAATVALIGKQFNMSGQEFVTAVQNGKISSEQLALAVNAMGKEINPTFANMNKTVGQSMENIRTSFILMLNEFEKSTGAFNGLAKSLELIAKHMDLVVAGAGVFFAVYSVKKILEIATAMKTLNAVIARNPLGLLALGITAGVAGLIALREKTEDATAANKDLADSTEAVRNQSEARKRTEQELTKEQMAGLEAYFRKMDAQRAAASLSGQELAVQKMISEAAQALKIKEEELSKTVRDRITQRAIEIYQQEQATKNAKLIADADLARNNTLRQANQALDDQLAVSLLIGDELETETKIREINRSLIKEIRDENGKILGYSKGLTQEEEAQLRAKMAKLQADREAVAVIQAQRQLLGQMTKIEAVQRGVGVQQRLNPQSALDVQYKMDMEALKAHLDAKLISEEDYQRDLLALKREYADKSNQLYINQVEDEKRQRQTAIQAEQMRMGKTAEQAKTYAEFMMKTDAEKAQFAIQQGAEIFSALGAQNKRAFEAAKAFNMANAIMNTYMAVTKALASYPFPFSLIAAGGALAFGLAQVAQIRSQQYSGRALGGPVMNNKTYMVGENGPELFTPTSNGSITRNSDLPMGNVVNVTFEITANDTTGFDQLLASRRGVIQQIISDAMLEKGKRSMV